MHNYDSVLKALLTSPQNAIFERITGASEHQSVAQRRIAGSAADASRSAGPVADWRLIALKLVLYVGTPEMGMSSELVGPNFYCGYKLLGRHGDRRENIRRILARIATLQGTARDAALKKLTIPAGIRKLGESIRTEVKHMPILDSMMDHDLLGPAFARGC